jgi:hypothetical protein
MSFKRFKLVTAKHSCLYDFSLYTIYFRLREAYNKRYLLPELVVTTVPALAPFRIGLVVIFCPSRNIFEFLIFPVILPSASCFQLLRVGMPSFLAVDLDLDAAAASPGDPKEIVPLRMTGACFFSAGVEVGAADFGLAAPPKSEKAGLGAGVGAGGGTGAATSFFGAGLAAPPKSEKAGLGAGVGAGGGTGAATSFFGAGLAAPPKSEKACLGAEVGAGGGTGAATSFFGAGLAAPPKSEKAGLGAGVGAGGGTGAATSFFGAGLLKKEKGSGFFATGTGAGAGSSIFSSAGFAAPKKSKGDTGLGVGVGGDLGGGSGTSSAFVGVEKIPPKRGAVAKRGKEK